MTLTKFFTCGTMTITCVRNFLVFTSKFMRTISIKLFGRQVYPLSDRIKPLTIDKKAKWNYMSKVGAAGHLDTENVKTYRKIIEDYNNCA